MRVGRRSRIVALTFGTVLVVVSVLVAMQWDRIVEWYQLRRMVGTWEDLQLELLVDRDSFAFYVPILSPEITVTHDRHIVVTSPFEDGPKTWRIPFSVEADKLRLHVEEPMEVEYSFGFTDAGELFLDDDIARSKYRRR